MIREVAIFPNSSEIVIPDKFLEDVKSSKNHFRVCLANKINLLEDTHEEINSDVLNDFDFNRIDTWYIKAGDVFYFKGEGSFIMPVKIQIVGVDTSRKWRVANDFGEYVEYLDYKLIDEELNLHE